ncbi:hypothetical protein EAG_10742 [Camponotus floridanus]|uniref:Uncharacterized protein n=1 Tax=Camponotus floridanus TaxID=104421 RepID=E2AXJ7_CAMFO|nr:hypothetical protein EAG_10742 [Camponotus floridanus]
MASYWSLCEPPRGVASAVNANFAPVMVVERMRAVAAHLASSAGRSEFRRRTESSPGRGDFFLQTTKSEARRSLSAGLDAFAWNRRSVLGGCELQTTPRQLIEIDNGESRLGGGPPHQGLHLVERCPGAPEPVAPVPAPAADARSSFIRDSSSGLLSHPRTAHRSVTRARERLSFLPKIPDDSALRLAGF